MRTSRSDDGCAALTGGTAASSRLNSRSPADAVRDGTKRSEYTVSFFPLEPSDLALGDIITWGEGGHSRRWGDAGGSGDAAFHASAIPRRRNPFGETECPRAFRHDTHSPIGLLPRR